MPALRAALMTLGAALAGETPSGHAVELRQRPTLVVGASETVHDDLYASGRTVQIQGTIEGDLVAAGSEVSVTGTVNGDILAAGGTVTVSGPVRGTVRAAGGRVSIHSTVEQDVVVAGGRVELGPEGRVGRDALFGAGETEVAGKIARNVRAGTGRLTLAESAVINGDLVYSSGKPLGRSPGATVRGRLTRLVWRGGEPPTAAARVLSGILGWLKGLIGLTAFGLLTVLLLPGLAPQVAQTLSRSPWQSVGLGALLLVTVPFVAVLALIVGIVVGGWWIGLALLAMWLVALPLGYVFGSLRVGQWIARRLGRPSTGLVLTLFLGLVAVGLAGAIPFLGRIASLGACLFGLGAFGLALGRAIRERRMPRVPETA